MGRAVRASIAEFPDMALAACVARSTDADGCPPGCSWMTPDQLASGGAGALPAEAVVIDVSLSAGTARLLEWLERSPRALVSATTGLAERDEARIQTLASRTAVLRARNLSVGNAVVSRMLQAVRV